MRDGVANNNAKGAHAFARTIRSSISQLVFWKLTSKRKCELEERYSCSATWTKAVVHDLYVRASAGKLCVDNNEANCPVCNRTKSEEERNSCKETRLTDGVWQP